MATIRVAPGHVYKEIDGAIEINGVIYHYSIQIAYIPEMECDANRILHSVFDSLTEKIGETACDYIEEKIAFDGIIMVIEFARPGTASDVSEYSLT